MLNVPPSNCPKKHPLSVEGILLVHKERKRNSFSLVSSLRKLTGVKKIGHAGTLDPFAEGLMVMLIGKKFTKLSDRFLNDDKEYIADIYLGKVSETFDSEGTLSSISDRVPTIDEIESVIEKNFQGKQLQIPPMYSAKKVAGQKLYKLARKGITIERKPIEVQLDTNIISYEYPHIKLHVTCSKGTYIRTIADDFGKKLETGAYLEHLVRVRSGSFHLKNAVKESALFEENFVINDHLIVL